MNDTDEYLNLFQWLIKTHRIHTVSNYYSKSPINVNLKQIIGIESELTSPYIEKLSRFCGNDILLRDNLMGYECYQQFQDILDTLVFEDAPILHQNYCYFESIVYLREIITSWANQNLLASMVLLRPFLELSILHLYWRTISEKDNYKSFSKWFYNKENTKPQFKKQLETVIFDLKNIHPGGNDLLELIHNSLITNYKAFNPYQHSPALGESIINKVRINQSKQLPELFMIPELLQTLLKNIILLYIFSYPMIVFPVDRYKKWGFDKGPVGIFGNFSNYYVIESFLVQDELKMIIEILKKSEKVVNFLEYFNNLPYLSKKEIDKMWIDYVSSDLNAENLMKISNTNERLQIAMMQQRIFQWVMIYYDPTSKKL